MKILGATDVVDRISATGWVYCVSSPGLIEVQATLDNQVIGEAAAMVLRQDLADVGIGDGRCGFLIEFYKEIDVAYIPFVVVKVGGGDVELPRYSMSGFKDYFHSLFLKHPSAGRSRCVLGGLWTDRTDSMSILRGKIAINELPSAETKSLEKIIGDGYVLLETIKRLQSSDVRQSATAVVTEPSMLKILQQMFEDNPIVLSFKLNKSPEVFFAQPSNSQQMPSPAECASIVVPIDEDGIAIEIVRQSHQFPEFSAAGQSRWIAEGATAGIEVSLARHGLVDRVLVKRSQVVLIGPGLIHRVQSDASKWLRILCTPARHAPLQNTLASLSN